MSQANRSYHHGHLRHQLLSTARQLLDERGPSALTLREVARRAGVAAPSAYHHFANLDTLAATLAEQGFAELAAALEAAPTDERGRLAPTGEAYITWARANPELYRLMFGEGFRTAIEASNGVHASRGRAHTLLVTGLQRRLPDRDLPAATLLAWSLVHGLTMLLIDNQSDPGAASLIPDVFRLATRGIPLGPASCSGLGPDL